MTFGSPTTPSLWRRFRATSPGRQALAWLALFSLTMMALALGTRPSAGGATTAATTSLPAKTAAAPPAARPAQAPAKAAAAAPVPAAQAKAAAPVKPAGTKYTVSQQQAIGAADQYLSDGLEHFSYEGLISQLSSPDADHFSVADATFAAEHVSANWDQQAAGSVQDYFAAGEHFSHDGLVSQLEYDKYTPAQAAYGANSAGANWDQQAAGSAKEYLAAGEHFSHDGLVSQLEYDKYTPAQAAYGASSVGL